MIIKKLDCTDSELAAFAQGVNAAYKARSNEKIPYHPITVSELQDMLNRKEGIISNVYVMEDDGIFAGGVICYHNNKTAIKTATINKLFVRPEEQKKGIARSLLEYAECEAKTSGIQMMQLDVANSYVPAVKLYKKMGYVPFSVFANEPNTYYFIRFKKSIQPYKYSELKRVLSLCYSKFIFSLLFKKDSSPSAFNIYVYRKLRK